MSKQIINQLQPTTDQQRQVGVDAIRGVALFLILFVNLEFLSQTIDDGWSRAAYDAVWDDAARWVLVAVFQLKAYLIFALLFGYGLAMQLARSAGPGFTPRYLRRMAGLVVLGVLHGIFFFAGDILMCYGLIGAVLLAFRNVATRTLLRIAVAAYAGGIAVLAALPSGDMRRTDVDAIREIYASGSFWEVARQRAEDFVLAQGFGIAVQWPSVFAFFLIGLALGRTNVFADPTAHVALFRRLVRWALPIGLAGGATAATLGAGITSSRDDLAFVIQALTGPASALGYIGVFGLLLATGRARGFVGRAAPVGRMSLTVYLGESIVASLIFNGYGLGLFGTVGPFVGLLMACGLWLAFVPFDRFWLARFRFGPFEWALRSVTYLSPQPLRREGDRVVTRGVRRPRPPGP